MNRNRSAREDPAETDAMSAPELCVAVAKSIGAKADKNRRRARALVMSTTASTAAIPVFIGLSGDHFVPGKLIPSVLAAISAMILALGQIERPHERWILYRRYQRKLEAESKRFRFRVAPYDGENPESELGAMVARVELDLQAEWEGLIPQRDEISGFSKGVQE